MNEERILVKLVFCRYLFDDALVGNERSLSPGRLHQLAERLSSVVRASLRQVASSHGLKLVQLEALVYLSLANRYSNTPAALTEYLGITKGTVSQTISALQRHELIEKRADLRDGRVQRIGLTEAGRAIVEDAYPSALFGEGDDATNEGLADALEAFLRALQRRNGFKTFGQCSTCRFFERRTRASRCGLTLETLSRQDSRKLCREHEASQDGAA